MTIERVTNLILGAGSSWDYGFPLGGDPLHDSMMSYLKGRGEPSAMISGFRTALGQSGVSIDQFLNERLGYTAFGRIGIAGAILSCQRPGALCIGPQARGSDWMQRFFRRLGRTEAEILTSLRNLRVVTFNYDICFEARLWNTLFYRFQDRAASLFAELQIKHVYGAVSDFDPLSSSAESYWFSGAGDLYTDDVVDRAGQRILLVGRSEVDIPGIQKLMEGSEVYLFLGFGFDPANISILGSPDNPRSLGTGTKMSFNDRAEAERSWPGLLLSDRGQDIHGFLSENPVVQFIEGAVEKAPNQTMLTQLSQRTGWL